MNKTKTIYFLSAIVCIIGCYALNLSYSLFIQTEKAEVLNSTVAYLGAELSLTSVEVDAGKEYLIKQTITNTGTADMNYAINANSTSENYSVKLASDSTTTYTSSGTLETNNSTETYLVVSNTGTETITINFTLDKNYTTLTNNLVSNITEVYNITLAELPYNSNKESLSYNIMARYAGSKNVATNFDFLFSESITKVSLPLESTLEVPVIETFNSTATTELGLFQAEDDYGTSYYYRGASSVNYVDFAGFTWRIARINGDGSIRLILNDLIKDESGNDIKPTFNEFNNDNAYIGYMYGTPGSDNYDDTHKNINSSRAKQFVDNWYVTYIENETNNIHYQKYLSIDTLFCGDKTLVSDEYIEDIGQDEYVPNNVGYGLNNSVYSAYSRIDYESTLEYNPTLKCAYGDEANATATNENANIYSRYTVNETTTPNGAKTNGNLDYPVAILTADELAYAGVANTLYENALGSYGFWTMTPSFYVDELPTVYSLDYGAGLSSQYDISFEWFGLKPVINLRSDILVASGDGSSKKPYNVKLPIETTN